MNDTELLQSFLSEQEALIVDSSSSARVSLTSTLVQLGAKRHKLSLVGTTGEARAEIRRIKPRIIFCDFMIGKESGLDLILDQRQEYGESSKDCLFVLVTSNASQSTIARAAEEDIDTFVIKPYTIPTFQKCLAEAIRAKVDPGEYAKLINRGKEHLDAGELDQAQSAFDQARKLEPKPTLACFYLGKTQFMKSEMNGANDHYREGLTYNKIHYKCLIGLFDLFMQQKEHEKAYEVVKKMVQYYPANPRRLSSVLRLAIMTSNYEDIEGYYRIFAQIEERTDELIRYICSALAITGKYYLSHNTKSRGVELFEKIAQICGSRLQYMRYAIETMIRYECKKEAEAYLDRFPATQRGKPDYLISSLLVASQRSPSGEVIQTARKLIQEGIEDPSVYLTLIEHSARAKLLDSAENLAMDAEKKWPDRANDFKLALEQRTDSANRA